MSTQIKPSHKSITTYYQTLHDLAAQNVSHEMGLRRAFQTLLAETARLHDWTLVTEDTLTTASASTVRPDATLRDKNTLPRGFWESKDTADSLTKEIAKKSAKGYSLVNTIFEDSEKAILYQNGKPHINSPFDLSDPQQVCDLLNAFYAHTEPDFEHWEEAVEDFKDRVPELAKGLVGIIEDAHKKNAKFKKAFADFFTLCQTSLNPNIAQAAVDEMLIQHILTERLFRTIFNAADFTQRNVIAAEVEKVITALASQSFSREEYLKGLDRFYLAIEAAARHLEWTEKQHFLNTIYERFFQGYSVKTADTMGIVYTPQEIVDFMCASVVEVLKSEFNKDLGDPDVFVLDPCTGTGNFIVNLLRRIPPKKLPKAYANNFFANEIMLMPYYIAALNIEHAHYELSGRYEPFEGLCFVDTLDIADHKQGGLDFFTQRNTDRVQRQRKSPITVVIGNPPYNANQVNENDNNKNRKYPTVDARIKATYVTANSAQKTKLYDPYVRFFRWATDRLAKKDGIVCLVTNNSFVHQTACDGLQRFLAREFTKVYHLDLRGHVRQNPTMSGTMYNVFGIQLGVGVTIAIRNTPTPGNLVNYASAKQEWRREEKLHWVRRNYSVTKLAWSAIKPEADGTWMRAEGAEEFADLIAMGSKEGKAAETNVRGVIFQLYSLGVSTNRDDIVYDIDKITLLKKVREFVSSYNIEMLRFHDEKPKPTNIDEFVKTTSVKWSRNLKRWLSRAARIRFDPGLVRTSMYRPFSKKWLYAQEIAVDEFGQIHRILPSEAVEQVNKVIIVPTVGCERPFFSMAVSSIPNLNFVGFGGGGQCFPFYVYDEDGTNRGENITDWALNQFRTHYHDKKLSKWEIFYYVYGILHHPAYREKFADNLKRELPRIPFAPDFRAFAKAGKKLADLHLNYESTQEFPLTEIVTPGKPRSPRVESKMKLSKDKTSITVNDSLTLAGIPPKTFDYKLGNRSALEWIIDQYQVYTDKRTGITSDPNAWGEEYNNPEYIVQLVGKIITVSLETQKIIATLPEQFAPAPSE